MIEEQYLEELIKISQTRALIMQKSGLSVDMEFEDLVNLLIAMEVEKIQKENISDSSISYEDEIVSIEEMGELDTVDITVTGDQLFYCNGILTKNSMGLPHTVDAMFALITNEQLHDMGQLMIKQLKNRWGDLSYFRRFVVGIDRSKMKLYDLEESAQSTISNETSSAKPKDKTTKTSNLPTFDFDD